MDVKNFYYEMPMERYEYMRLPRALLPSEIVAQYHLDSLAHDGWVYMEIRKGMPGLKQAGKIANERLRLHLAKYGYTPTPRTPALWKHATRPVTFTLVVDDFGIKYEGDDHAQHLITSLQALYKVSIDWTASLYCGLRLVWDYTNRTVDVSMPGYIHAALHRFQHPPHRRAARMHRIPGLNPSMVPKHSLPFRTVRPHASRLHASPPFSK